MSITLHRTDNGDRIDVGDEVTLTHKGATITATVTDLEPPEPESWGCVHLKDASGKQFNCPEDALGAEWIGRDGQPVRFDADPSDREDFDSGRWTREDTESMERGPDLPRYNDAGEPCW